MVIDMLQFGTDGVRGRVGEHPMTVEFALRLGVAADLEGAMSFAEREIDLAIVDLNLRDGLTGPQIGQRLANEHNAAVLFVTANPRLLGDGVAGTIGVLTKPTDEDSLLTAVAYASRRRSGDEQVEAPPFIRCFG